MKSVVTNIEEVLVDGLAVNCHWQAYITWLVYSVGLSAKICMIYGPWYIVVDNLTERIFFGLNTLRLAVSLTGVIFFLLVSTHYHAPAASQRQVRVVMATSNDDDDCYVQSFSYSSSL